MQEGLILTFKKFCYFLHGMMIRRLQGTYAGAQSLAHVLVFHLLEVLHVEDDTLLGRQLADSLLELQLGLVAIEVRVALEGQDDGTLGIVQTRVLTAPLHVVQRLVDGYTAKPGIYTRLAPEVFQIDPGLDERVLQDIIAVVMLEHDTADLPIERLLVFADQEREGLFAGLLVLQLAYEIRFVYHHGVLLSILAPDSWPHSRAHPSGQGSCP